MASLVYSAFSMGWSMYLSNIPTSTPSPGFMEAKASVKALEMSIKSLTQYNTADAEKIRELEDKADHYEDVIGNYLVKLSAHNISDDESAQAARLLRLIGDFERISDHAVNILESAEEIRDKEITFTAEAERELGALKGAVMEISTLALNAFLTGDENAAFDVEPLEEIIDRLKEKMRANHILRLQQGNCGIEVGLMYGCLCDRGVRWEFCTCAMRWVIGG